MTILAIREINQILLTATSFTIANTINLSRGGGDHTTWYVNLFSSRFFFFRLSELFFYPLLAHLDIGAGVEQAFGCLIVQNRQAV